MFFLKDLICLQAKRIGSTNSEQQQQKKSGYISNYNSQMRTKGFSASNKIRFSVLNAYGLKSHIMGILESQNNPQKCNDEYSTEKKERLKSCERSNWRVEKEGAELVIQIESTFVEKIFTSIRIIA